MLRKGSFSTANVKRLLKTSVLSNFLNLGSIQISNALIMMLLYPILARKVGLEAFGALMVANATASLIGIVVNFGTNQSGIKDVASHKENQSELSKVVYSTLLLRFILFGSFLLIFLAALSFNLITNIYFIYAVPLILAEVLNPLFIYLGKESLSVFNIANLATKIIIISLAIFVINGPGDAVWVNFILGTAHIAVYLFLIARIIILSKLSFNLPDRMSFKMLLKSNFYLVGNNLSVHLQQSLMLFAMAKWGNPAWLGPYSLCDKITWSGRLLIMSMSNAIYPKATILFHSKIELFNNFKKQARKLFALAFLGFSLFLAIFAEYIVIIITGQPDQDTIFLLRIMAFLQVFAAINSFNVLELLIRGQNNHIFRIGMLLFILSIILSAGIAIKGNLFLLGTYTLILEITAVLLYESVIRKNFYRARR